MSAEITRGRKQVFPTFRFAEHPEAYPYEAITAQMAESGRNVLIDIERRLATMQHTLERIERRLATRMPLKRGRH